MVAHYRVGLPVGYSARKMAAGLVRAAIDSGDGLLRDSRSVCSTPPPLCYPA